MRKTPGFILIEVVTTVIILVFIVGGVMEIFRQSYVYIKKTREKTVAFNLAREVMEKYSDWDSLPANGTHTNPAPYPLTVNNVVYNVEVTVSDDPVYQPLYPNQLKRVNGAIYWGTDRYEFFTLKANY